MPGLKDAEVYRAGLPMLGARLLQAAKMVRQGAAVADVGCDHGKLAVWLAKTGGASKVLAVDKRPMPLARAKALTVQTASQHIVSCRLGNGLLPVHSFEVQDIIIAGLGGETAIEILKAAPWVFEKNIQLVLVPATRHAILRKFLCENGFALLQDVPVEENGKVYAVMQAAYTGECAQASALFCELGYVPNAKNAAALAYVKKCIERLEKQTKGRLTAQEIAKLKELLQEVREVLHALQQES